MSTEPCEQPELLRGLLKNLCLCHREPEGRRDLASNRMLEARLRRRSENVAPRNDRLLGFFNNPLSAGKHSVGVRAALWRRRPIKRSRLEDGETGATVGRLVGIGAVINCNHVGAALSRARSS
jgi:hypothetical protein